MVLFKKRDWTKYEHVMFVEDFRGGIKTYELLFKTDLISGETKYKKVFVKSCVHNLQQSLTVWMKELKKIR